MPDRRTREAVDDGYAEARRGTRGVHHLLGSALLHAFGAAVAPHARWHDAPVALVDAVADRLPHEMIGDREDFQPMPRQQVASLGAVALVGERALDVEVVAPT